ncbi:glycosyltransferase BC10-like [Primulina huaijiensis]|uniref:glycosyltransferase BC10-like n=1 Tax=Primulina huaijiensis TaxID=1492673 RepID=UPI003CC7049B
MFDHIELSKRMRRYIKDGRYQVAMTIMFGVFLTFLVLVLGMIVNDHFKKFILYENLQNSPLNAFLPLYMSNISKLNSNDRCFSSNQPRFNDSNTTYDLRFEWLSPKDIWHSMSDQELMWRASMVPHLIEYPFNRVPKVAFMFLTKGRLPLGPLWEMFFKGHEALFTIYIHSSPEFAREPPESSVFYKRRIPSKEVQWGDITMIDAERRLLANALLDLLNERFILLSETCIPLFNFTTIYNYLINSNHSFLNSFDDLRRIGRGRYNPRMSPAITLPNWRKGSQWFEASRNLAINIISDVTYYPIFRNHCMPPCYVDEHYFPTLVNIICPNLTSNRTVTWTDWSRGGSHPLTFNRIDVTEEFLERIRYGSNCTYNGEMSNVCFLFARKFHPSTLLPLLRIAPKLFGFNV